ncbi:hypothetical protein PPROV_000933500 [Pycnococcus provasolii]|uniref:Uncharacterized protein n=1 Tax=Pycnococcus provasolii TaxID=41880 RepID=A0A830HTT8_9CHLO|nr:hypothetical protein PPROV_000933500 [Pycnococcus provasolii]
MGLISHANVLKPYVGDVEGKDVRNSTAPKAEHYAVAAPTGSSSAMVATTRAGRAVHLALKMPSPVKIKAVVSRKKKRVTFGPSEDAATSKKRKTKAAGVMEGLDELARAASASTSANGGAEDSGKKETAEKKRIRSTNKSEFVVVARVKLLRSFHLVEEMPNEQKICEYIQYTCTCHGKLGIKHKFGFQCTRKCKHVLARALRDGLFTVPPDMKLGVVAKPKSAGGRAKRAGKALEPESSESEEEDDGFSECSSDDSGEDDIE